MSHLPHGLNTQHIAMFQTFFTKVNDTTLDAKGLAKFTRMVLAGTSISSRNNPTENSYRRHQEGQKTWRDFKGVYGEQLLLKGATPGFLTLNNAMGASKPSSIDGKVKKILRDANNWEKIWDKQSRIGWYVRCSADELAEYKQEEKNRAMQTKRLYSNNALVQQVIRFRQDWQYTFDQLSYAKKSMKQWNRARREAKKAAKPPMIGGVQMPDDYHRVSKKDIKLIENLLNDGILPQYEQWKVDEFARVSDLIVRFDKKNQGKVWTEQEMFSPPLRRGYRPICTVAKFYFTYTSITPSLKWASKDRTWTYEGVKETWKDELQAKIEEDAENMRLQFIGYMMEKVLPVVANKSSPMSDATNYRDRRPRFGEYIRFNFAFSDGSSFDLEGNIEQSYSSRGLRFFRFPRRFYNVILPSGLKVKKGKMVPFAQMIASFCRA